MGEERTQLESKIRTLRVETGFSLLTPQVHALRDASTCGEPLKLIQAFLDLKRCEILDFNPESPTVTARQQMGYYLARCSAIVA